jgi:hypothetical protein
MDLELSGTLILSGAAVPYVVEVLRQLPILTRVMAKLPPEVRARLPPHPRRPRLAVFGSARFFVALFRWALRRDAADSAEVAALKRQMRMSAAREAVSGTLLLAVFVVLVRAGWRPPWPPWIQRGP